ncbi:hypothetical protein JX265_002309 [Neoarthrinium moseri]|uniref:Uncharacterized protein n=1 Tax=Neoarthrinium moseri TaxID=1658444 RepID=A0A9P9WUN9_9PEZI|nr:uncharacterized protein JN550_000121 [Neoarthrinium moseri]KAI1877939.1 hypothetical protein JN550_000121 [Neoarthrinium moseri]KAI1879355.1 hypothetical protein JX265_002309 [Neoarthrinium moseri]
MKLPPGAPGRYQTAEDPTNSARRDWRHRAANAEPPKLVLLALPSSNSDALGWALAAHVVKKEPSFPLRELADICASQRTRNR